MLAFVFPGQGSQARGMGGTLFDEVEEFRRVEATVDRCLGYSVRRLCLEGPFERLSETSYTQPCMYVVNALHYYKAVAEGGPPDLVAGHSLGEYNALMAAGAFDFLTGLRLVQQRGVLMSLVRNGGMGAVIGLDASRVQAIIAEHGLATLDVANYNSPTQTVVSGPTADIGRAQGIFARAGARIFMPLPVSAAFHSRYMTNCARAFGEVLAAASFRPLTLPVIANLTARPYPSESPPTTIPAILTAQITAPVRWADSVRTVIEMGASRFREIGPGSVLSKLLREIQEQPVARVPVAHHSARGQLSA